MTDIPSVTTELLAPAQTKTAQALSTSRNHQDAKPGQQQQTYPIVANSTVKSLTTRDTGVQATRLTVRLLFR